MNPKGSHQQRTRSFIFGRCLSETDNRSFVAEEIVLIPMSYDRILSGAITTRDHLQRV